MNTTETDEQQDQLATVASSEGVAKHDAPEEECFFILNQDRLSIDPFRKEESR